MLKNIDEKNYKNIDEKIIVRNIIIGVLGSIYIKVDIFFISKKDGEPITCFLIFIFFIISLRYLL